MGVGALDRRMAKRSGLRFRRQTVAWGARLEDGAGSGIHGLGERDLGFGAQSSVRMLLGGKAAFSYTFMVILAGISQSM